MEQNRQYEITADASVPFRNQTGYCVGTGRMGLALQKEYMDQLALVQKEIGFSHIRGHGLFCDDIAIYHAYTDEQGNRRAEYNFTYLDLVMDQYRNLGLKPFLELGFMPEQLASGEQTVFYWKGNVTPPKEYEGWCELVRATLSHLMERYGADEVVTWPIEVWNEPNLAAFWKDADMEEYFHLFQQTFSCIKALDARFRVGGPAICGVEDERWIRCFMEFCQKEHIPVDFVTRHHYTTEEPHQDGHYQYQKLADPEAGFANLQTTRDIIDSFEEYRGLEIHITEFNTSYVPDNPLHDTNQNAAYIAQQLSRLGDMNESYSYWTFGDIFEEKGVPFAPFHGGFGLVANGCIPKPTFWTFQFYQQLSGQCIHRSEDDVILKDGDGWNGILWNSSLKRTGCTKHMSFQIDHPQGADGQEYLLLTKTVDETTCNPLKLWHEMGEPRSLTENQKELLRECARPQLRSRTVCEKDGRIELTFDVEEFGVEYFTLVPVKRTPDRGYDYVRVMRTEWGEV